MGSEDRARGCFGSTHLQTLGHCSLILGHDWLSTRWVDRGEKQILPQALPLSAFLLAALRLRPVSEIADTPHSERPFLLPSFLAAMRTTAAAVVMVMSMAMVQADLKPQRDFSLQRFAGRWYRVGLAYDSVAFVPFRDKLRASMGLITPLTNGNVNLTMWEATPFGCVTKLYQYRKTTVPGQFSYFSTRHNMVKDITVVDTNYNEYALVVKHKVFNREYTQVALYTRSQRVSNDILQKYKSLALSRGFPRESILTPLPAENCPAPGTVV